MQRFTSRTTRDLSSPRAACRTLCRTDLSGIEFDPRPPHPTGSGKPSRHPCRKTFCMKSVGMPRLGSKTLPSTATPSRRPARGRGSSREPHRLRHRRPSAASRSRGRPRRPCWRCATANHDRMARETGWHALGREARSAEEVGIVAIASASATEHGATAGRMPSQPRGHPRGRQRITESCDAPHHAQIHARRSHAARGLGPLSTWRRPRCAP